MTPSGPANGRLPVVVDVRVVTEQGGGPDKTILNSPRFLPRYRNLCAYMHPPGDPGFERLRKRAAACSAPLVSIPDRGPLDYRVLVELLNLCRRERVQIWHGHDYKSNAIGLLLRRFWPMRLVTTVHGWVKHTHRTPLYYRIDRFCLPRYDRVICVSPDLVDEALAARVPHERCLLIENGIDIVQHARNISTCEAQRRLGVPPGRQVVGAVGRLSPEKGFDLFIRAAHQLWTDGSDFELWIVGDGAEKEALSRLAKELECGDRLRLLGFRANVIELYEAMDAFVLSSLREGLPNVLLEAMALEVAVVATTVAGVPRLIEDGVNGLLIEPGKPEAIAAGLKCLLDDDALRHRLSTNGRQTVEKNYSFQVRMKRIEKVYDELLMQS